MHKLSFYLVLKNCLSEKFMPSRLKNLCLFPRVGGCVQCTAYFQLFKGTAVVSTGVERANPSRYSPVAAPVKVSTERDGRWNGRHGRRDGGTFTKLVRLKYGRRNLIPIYLEARASYRSCGVESLHLNITESCFLSPEKQHITQLETMERSSACTHCVGRFWEGVHPKFED
jgi:hypothetical protein